MTDPDDYYAVNTIPPLAWAFELYFAHKGRFKDTPIIEVLFPAGAHKGLVHKKGSHDFILWISKRFLYVRARCLEDKDCEFNTERIDARDREALKALSWNQINSRKFFAILTKWLLRLNLDMVLFIRALNTVCDSRVVIPLTTEFGKTFERFNDYRKTRWPSDVTPEKLDRFLEELLIRVAFWFQAAAAVKALK